MEPPLPPRSEPETLLEKTQAMIKIERLLTLSMEKVEPWLTSNTTDPQYASRNSNTVWRVRPVPSTMEQVEQVLAVARNLSTRTSAPAGWNPNAPVVGFSTPNPLPHQLRGGALGALELQRARQQLQEKAAAEQKKRKQREEEEKLAKKQKLEREKQEGSDDPMDLDSSNRSDPKAMDAASHRPKTATPATVTTRPTAATTAPRTLLATPQQAQQQLPVTAATMNLSDSSSSEEDDDDDSD